MIGFFPDIYPDELLYSQLCRYYQRTGYTKFLFAVDSIAVAEHRTGMHTDAQIPALFVLVLEFYVLHILIHLKSRQHHFNRVCAVFLRYAAGAHVDVSHRFNFLDMESLDNLVEVIEESVKVIDKLLGIVVLRYV